MKVVIAAGHGGGDPGATGQGTTEAAEAVDITNRTADKLRADGQLEVVVVPHELNLIDEINWVNANASNADLAAEIHKNATPNAHGVEVWFYGGDQVSAGYANKTLSRIMSVPGMPVSRGIKPDTSNRYGRLGWIRDTTPPALLFEMGFISAGGDPVGAQANDMYAEGLLRGFLALFGLAPKPNTPPPSVPPVATVNYRVIGNDGKQIGAYAQKAGAWNKYQSVQGAAKIVDKEGNDVTSQFVAEFTPPAPQPAPGNEPDPKEKEQDDRISALEAIIGRLIAFLRSIFKGDNL